MESFLFDLNPICLVAEHAQEKNEDKVYSGYKADKNDKVSSIFRAEPQTNEDHYRAHGISEKCAQSYEDSIATCDGLISGHFSFKLWFITAKRSLVDMI